MGIRFMAFTPNLIQPDQIQSPQDLFNFCRDELIIGVKKSKHPFHLCTLCTVMDGRPFARTVVSRGVNPNLTQCRIHSDKRSQKNNHIMQSPHVALVYYSPIQKLQIRVEGIAQMVSNTNDEDYFFDTSSPHSQLCYAFPSPPGTVIEEKTKERRYPQITIYDIDAHKSSARTNFSAISITIQSMDALWLSKSEHIRMHGQRIDNAWDLKFIIA